MSDHQEKSGMIELHDEARAGFIESIRLIGQTVYELLGKSAIRMLFVFVAVYVASFLPVVFIIIGTTVASQTNTRIGLFIGAAVCLTPLAAIAGFNYIAYQGLRDIVRKLGFGQVLAAEFIAFLVPSDRATLPVDELTNRVTAFCSQSRDAANANTRGTKRIVTRVTNRLLFFVIRLAIQRIAKGCLVDGEVDLDRFGTALADRLDDLLIDYFKKLLWDLNRLLLGIAVLAFWLTLYLVIQLLMLFL